MVVRTFNPRNLGGRMVAGSSRLACWFSGSPAWLWFCVTVVLLSKSFHLNVCLLEGREQLLGVLLPSCGPQESNYGLMTDIFSHGDISLVLQLGFQSYNTFINSLRMSYTNPTCCDHILSHPSAEHLIDPFSHVSSPPNFLSSFCSIC